MAPRNWLLLAHAVLVTSGVLAQIDQQSIATLNLLLPAALPTGGAARHGQTRAYAPVSTTKTSFSAGTTSFSSRALSPTSSIPNAPPPSEEPESGINESSTEDDAPEPKPTGRQYTPVTGRLANGESYQTGSFNSSLRWQSSGILEHGGCPVDALIGDCYSIYLSSDGMLEPMKGSGSSRRRSKRMHPRHLLSPDDVPDMSDPYDPSLGVDSPYDYFKGLRGSSNDQSASASSNPDLGLYSFMTKSMAKSSDSGASNSCSSEAKGKASAKQNAFAAGEGSAQPAPRQRVEFLSWPPAPSGETWDYQWRTYIDDRTTTSKGWWHMMQLLQRSGCGGYVIAQDAEKGKVFIKDKNRACVGGVCSSYAYDDYKGRTMSYHVRVRYGTDGIFGYKVKDVALGKTVLEYNTVGDVGSSSSVKFGVYRQAVEGMSEARMYVGDYVAKRIA